MVVCNILKTKDLHPPIPWEKAFRATVVPSNFPAEPAYTQQLRRCRLKAALSFLTPLPEVVKFY